jgi:hypothetical protein
MSSLHAAPPQKPCLLLFIHFLHLCSKYLLNISSALILHSLFHHNKCLQEERKESTRKWGKNREENKSSLTFPKLDLVLSCKKFLVLCFVCLLACLLLLHWGLNSGPHTLVMDLLLTHFWIWSHYCYTSHPTGRAPCLFH